MIGPGVLRNVSEKRIRSITTSCDQLQMALAILREMWRYTSCDGVASKMCGIQSKSPPEDELMAQCGMLRDYRFTNAAEDIRGSKLYGLNDEKLGKIDDVIFEHASGTIRYVAVDTGGWLSTKKFIVPAERLRCSA